MDSTFAKKMKISRRDFYTLAGLGLIVGSLFAAAKAIGGLVALIYFITSTNFSETDPSMGENIINTWKASQTSGMVHGVGSFLILFFSGRWMLRGPKFLNRWIDEGDSAAVEEANNSKNNQSEQDVTPNA
jgi:hypothetical protein